MATLTPAYGRDYKSAKDVIADYVDGKEYWKAPEGFGTEAYDQFRLSVFED